VRAALAVLALAACGPPLAPLLEHRHYREAICAGADGFAGDRAAVRRALAANAEAQLHVEMVPVASVAELVTGRVRFARVRLQTNALPVDNMQASAAISHGAHVDWRVLAAATGEQLPPNRIAYTYLNGNTMLKGLAAMLTFGASLPFTRFEQRAVEVAPTPTDYLAIAPHATALHAVMTERGCGDVGLAGTGLSCEWLVAIDAAPADDIVLDLAVDYVAHRHDPDDRDACRVGDTIRIPLGRAGELDATTARMFGPRARRIDGLDRR